MDSILCHKNGKVQNTNILNQAKEWEKYDKHTWTENTELFFKEANKKSQ